MARVMFDGLILSDRYLQNLKSVELDNKWNVISFTDLGEEYVLGTFDTDREAKDYINSVGEDMLASEAIHDMVDGRNKTEDNPVSE